MDRGPCAPANVAGYGRVVCGARFEEREPWFAVDGSRLYLDTPREFEYRVPRHLNLPKQMMGPLGPLFSFCFKGV